jgi:hypothetical protein
VSHDRCAAATARHEPQQSALQPRDARARAGAPTRGAAARAAAADAGVRARGAAANPPHRRCAERTPRTPCAAPRLACCAPPPLPAPVNGRARCPATSRPMRTSPRQRAHLRETHALTATKMKPHASKMRPPATTRRRARLLHDRRRRRALGDVLRRGGPRVPSPSRPLRKRGGGAPRLRAANNLPRPGAARAGPMGPPSCGSTGTARRGNSPTRSAPRPCPPSYKSDEPPFPRYKLDAHVSHAPYKSDAPTALRLSRSACGARRGAAPCAL